MNTKLFHVAGLANGTNKTQLKNALEKVKGVNKVRVSLPEGTVEVDYNEPADATQIQNCIEHTGFPTE